MAGALVLCLVAAACGGSSPTSPSQSSGGSGSSSGSGTGGGGTTGGGTSGGGTGSTSCRIGPASYRIVATGAGVTATTTGTCTFNNATVEGTCTNQYTDNTGQSFTSVSTTRHATRGDVVDEIAVIPPLQRSLGTTTTVSGSTSSTGTSAHTYDGQRRLLQTVGTSSVAGQTVTSTTTYTAWDASGRPTAGTTATAGFSTSVNYTYDNATRTQSTTNSGVTCSQTFDANGIPTVGTCSNGAQTTFTTLTTLQVCR